MRRGIIPACAGNTRQQHPAEGQRGDHPRVCGEHSPVLPTVNSPPGSSPRVRGTRAQGAHGEQRHGIIPACAGNTHANPGPNGGTGDHPRVCGEHSTRPMKLALSMGSSPRVRGTRRRASSALPWAGIIPACAGNTEDPAWTTAQRRDHPRVCGEHAVCPPMRPRTLGSSPRVRGTLRQGQRDPRDPGIIPACAGNTRFDVSRSARHKDHPRVCGEHVVAALAQAAHAGSSPRVRGTPAGRCRCAWRRRIIPACAGNTSGI